MPPKKSFASSASAVPIPKSASSGATWCSIDPRTNDTVGYSDADNAALEMSFKAGKPSHTLNLGGHKFTVVFAEMRQKNETGGARQVMRWSNEPDPTIQVKDIDRSLQELVMASVSQTDKAVEALEKNESSLGFTLPPGSFGDPSPVLAVFDSIIATFRSDRYKSRYGYNAAADESICRIQFGEPVPSYFANVKNQTTYHRKMLSILGLRNLVKFGPEIFLEMRAKMFSGRNEDYTDRTGPHKMRHFTGNAVDLDTTVLRPSDRACVDAVNLVQKRERGQQFSNGDELANSEVGRKIAIQSAKAMIDDFVSRFKLTAAQIRARQLDLDVNNLDIHCSTGNSDRGNFPLWKYQNVGVITFHANVPVMADLYGALLRAPFHVVKGFVLVHMQAKTPEELQQGLDAYFEDAVADSCFNAKWKAIEEFVRSRQQLGSIADELNKLQASRQDLFTPEFFDRDPDGTLELSMMIKLTLEGRLCGIDPKTKANRPITKEDVETWYRAVNGLPEQARAA